MQTENPDHLWSGLFISKILCESVILKILPLSLLQNPLKQILFYNN